MISSVFEKDYINEIDRPDYYALKGWESSLLASDIHADIVFFGNSITAGSNFQSYFPDKIIITLGYPGQNLRGMNRRVSHILACQPKKVFIMGGINDLHRQDPERVADRMDILLSNIKSKLPDTDIYVQSILPISLSKEDDYKDNTTIQQTNILIKKISLKHDATYVDLFALYYDGKELKSSFTKDGIHLYPKAYDIWASEIKRYIE